MSFSKLFRAYCVMIETTLQLLQKHSKENTTYISDVNPNEICEGGSNAEPWQLEKEAVRICHTKSVQATPVSV